MQKQSKIVTQQKFTCQESEQQQRNSALKRDSPLLLFQPPEDKDFNENHSNVLPTLVVTSVTLNKSPIKLLIKCLL